MNTAITERLRQAQELVQEAVVTSPAGIERQWALLVAVELDAVLDLVESEQPAAATGQ